MWLWGAMTASGTLSDRWLIGAAARLPLARLATVSVLGAQLEQLRGRSVVIAVSDPLTTRLYWWSLTG